TDVYANDFTTFPLFATTTVRWASGLTPHPFGPDLSPKTARAVFWNFRLACARGRYALLSSASAVSHTATAAALSPPASSSLPSSVLMNRAIGREKFSALTNR